MNNQTISLYKKIILLTSFCITTHTLTMEQEIAEVNILDWRSQCVPINTQSIATNHIQPSIQKNSPLDWRSQCVPVKQETTPVKHLVNVQYILINAIKINAVSTVNDLFKINHIHQRYNINLNATYKHNKKTPLHLAAKLQHTEIMEILLENGADQTIKDIQDNTPEFLLYKNIYQGATPILSNEKIVKNKKQFFKIHKILLCNRLEKLNIA